MNDVRFLPEWEANRLYPLVPKDRRERRPTSSSPRWKAIVAQVEARDRKRCRHCGVRGVGGIGGVLLVVDHILPIARGGRNTVGNLQLLCLSCNARKGSRMEAA